VVWLKACRGIEFKEIVYERDLRKMYNIVMYVPYQSKSRMYVKQQIKVEQDRSWKSWECKENLGRGRKKEH
jgi:hypothetical protein